MKLSFKQTYNGSCVDLEKELGLKRGDIQQIESDGQTMILTIPDGFDASKLEDKFNPELKIKKLETELADLKNLLRTKKII